MSNKTHLLEIKTHFTGVQASITALASNSGEDAVSLQFKNTKHDLEKMF